MNQRLAPSSISRIRCLVPVALVVSLGLAPHAGAGILYDFSFQFQQYSATGQMVLSDAVAVGEAFELGDVESFDITLFNDGVQVNEPASFPPFEGFDNIEGTRQQPILDIADLVVGDDFNITFGCTGNPCFFTGRIFFTSAPDNRLQLPPETVLDSFVFTEVPEAGAAALSGAALAALCGLRSSRAARSRAER